MTGASMLANPWLWLPTPAPPIGASATASHSGMPTRAPTQGTGNQPMKLSAMTHPWAVWHSCQLYGASCTALPSVWYRNFEVITDPHTSRSRCLWLLSGCVCGLLLHMLKPVQSCIHSQRNSNLSCWSWQNGSVLSGIFSCLLANGPMLVTCGPIRIYIT